MPGYGPTPDDVDRIRLRGADPIVSSRPAEAVAGANAIYTDVWASMGQERDAESRRQAFEGFSVDAKLLAAAGSTADVVFLHCLPAHRGEEVAADVIDGPQSLVFPQAENRLHAMRGLLLWLFQSHV